MFAKRDNHYPTRSGQTTLATAVTKFTKPVTKNYFGPSTVDDCDKTLIFELRLFLNAAGTGIFYGVLLYMLVVNRSEVISIFTGERRKDLQRQGRFGGSLAVSA